MRIELRLNEVGPATFRSGGKVSDAPEAVELVKPMLCMIRRLW